MWAAVPLAGTAVEELEFVRVGIRDVHRRWAEGVAFRDMIVYRGDVSIMNVGMNVPVLKLIFDFQVHISQWLP